MATSRTGTARWKRARTRALQAAQANGQTHCPLCNRGLNWHKSRTPSSPEPDHIIEYRNGGTDTPDNLRIICRQCNQRRGGKLGAQQTHRQKRVPIRTQTLTTSQSW